MNNIIRKMNKKRMKTIVASLGIIVVGIILCELYTLTGYNRNVISQEVNMDQGWIVSSGSKSYTDVNLKNFTFDQQIPEGQTVILYNKIPKDWNYDTPVLRLATHNSTVRVTVNGVVIYQYGQDRDMDDKLVGSGFHFIELQENYRGKAIKIEITPTVENSFVNVQPITICDYSDVYPRIMTDYRIPFVMGSFLLIFGFCLILLGFVTYVISTPMIRLSEIGMLTLCVGVWTICRYRLSQLFALPLYYGMTLEHMALYIGFVPFTLYFKYYLDELRNRIMEILYDLLLAVEIILMIIKAVSFVLQYKYIATVTMDLYFLFAFAVIYLTVLMIMLIRKGYTQGKIIIVGFYSMVTLFSVDAINILVSQRKGLEVIGVRGLSAGGTAIFIFILIGTFAMDIAGKLKTTTEKEILYRMAYTDVMTNVFNRRYCEEHLNTLSNQQKSYGIFNFDLNRLKETNDTLGHEYGDRLIIMFAEVLKKVFEQTGIVCRMGGDEFVVLIQDATEFNSNQYIANLLAKIDEINRSQEKLEISASYGYAQSDEMVKTDGKVDAKIVYSMSDSRMYEYKQKVEPDHRSGSADRTPNHNIEKN